MHLLWRRYARSGYAPPWFYIAMALGFLALAVWSAIRADWIVMSVALVMVPATFGGARLMRRLAAAEERSRRAMDDREGKDGLHE